MASADWKEVQRLASEFQRAQLSSTLQKLSEKNCIEIVSKLIELKLIDVFYTNDGKEYVTPQQLSREISDELIMHGGRIHLTELVPLLNISLHAIETRAQEIVQCSPDIHMVAGQLINDTYLNTIVEEINETLQQNGQLSIQELTKQYELSSDFLLQQIVSRLGDTIQGQQDKNDSLTFFTEGYLARNRAKIRGALSAITVPTSVSSLISQNKFPERLFFAVADELIYSKRIKGSISGGRQANVSTYIPDIYSRSQSEWVDSFLKQNGYLEYDALSRLGLPDPKGYCRKRFKESPLLLLSSCCVGRQILDQIEGAIEEGLASESWVDIMPLLPSVFNLEDAEQIIQEVLKSSKNINSKDALLIGESTIAHQLFIQKIKPIFEPMIQEKADQVVKSGAYLQAQADLRQSKMKTSSRSDVVQEKKDRKEERRKKANEGKIGGGTQGRETKTRATKKKYQRGKNDSDDDDDEEMTSVPASTSVDLEFMSIEDIEAVLSKEESLYEAPEDFVHEIANRLYKSLRTSFQEAARASFESLLSNSSGQRRQTHGELQDRISNLVQNIKQGDKALQQFSSLDVQQQLIRHLLKTLGLELISELLLYVAVDSATAFDTKDLTNEIRQKLIAELPQNLKGSLQDLLKSTQGTSIEEFLSLSENALSACDIVLRKPDKKKEKLLSTTQRQSLIEQLNQAQEAALVLHVAVILLFHSVTQTLLNASGRFVPTIITFLQPHLPTPTYDLFLQLQGLVIQELTAKDDEELVASLRANMEELIPRVREAAVVFKKSSSKATQE